MSPGFRLTAPANRTRRRPPGPPANSLARKGPGAAGSWRAEKPRARRRSLSGHNSLELVPGPTWLIGYRHQDVHFAVRSSCGQETVECPGIGCARKSMAAGGTCRCERCLGSGRSPCSPLSWRRCRCVFASRRARSRNAPSIGHSSELCLAEAGDPRVKQPTRPDGERKKSAERNPRIRARDTTPSLPLPPEMHRQSRHRRHLDDDRQHRQTHPGAGRRGEFHVAQPEPRASSSVDTQRGQ
jgi:hypothetical protein